MKKIFLISIIVAIILGVIFVPKIMRGNVISEGDIIKIPLSDVTSTAKFYEIDNVRFFAVKASDGSIKTAFDACDVCYYAHKGYRQEGNYMICNNCGNRYPISGLGLENKLGGGCWPGYLPSRIEGDNLIIMKSDINKGAYRF